MLNNEYVEETNKIRKNISGIKHKIVVMSGKGGVGKSTISVNLAGYLSGEGHDTGLLDIDLHGPSIPKLIGLSDKTIAMDDDFFIPIEYSELLKVISIGNMLNSEDQSVVWRGPKKNMMIRKFLKDVKWGKLDYLIVDSPPGTGDEQLSIVQTVDDFDGAVIVTTPQDIALIDVKKSINFCRQLDLPIIGIVENMSGFICPKCHEKIDLFKSGGGELLARKERVEFLGRISIDPKIVTECDKGNLIVGSTNSSTSKDEMLVVFNNIMRGI